MATNENNLQHCDVTESKEHLDENHTEKKADYENLLIEAILARNSLTTISSLIRTGLFVNKSTVAGNRPLHLAVECQYVGCVKMLISKGASINTADDDGRTPLLISASKGTVSVMETLIESGAIVNYCDAKNGEVTENVRQRGYLTYEPLNIAIENNHVQCVKLLLCSGANVNKEYYMGFEINLVPLNHKECIELLLKHGADPNVYSRSGITPLMRACKEDKIDIVKLLLKYGANVHMQCPLPFEQKSAILFAVEIGALDIVKILIANGAKLTKQSGCFYGLLHTAVLADSPDLCKYLLSINVFVDELADDGCTPLTLCAKSKWLKEQETIIKVLLQSGADPNKHAIQNTEYMTIQSTVVEYVRHNQTNLNTRVIQMLLRHGAKVNVRRYETPGKLDPFGILQALSDTLDVKILRLIVQSSKYFDIADILERQSLSKSCREFICRHALISESLKHIVRLELLHKFGKQLTDNIAYLELPATLKQFLTFET